MEKHAVADESMIGSPPFKTGDVVILKTGNSPIQILEVDYFYCTCRHDSPPNYAKARYSKSPRAGWYVRFRYASDSHNHMGSHHRKWREAEDFVLLNQAAIYGTIKNPDGLVWYNQKEENMPTLYQTKEDKPRFGTLLTKNSKGQLVLEMKGKEGEVEAFAADAVDEVMPFTVEMKVFQGGPGADRQVRHYEIEEGSVEVGDVVYQLSNGQMWEVTALDSKCRNPTASKNGFFKLEGKRL